MFTCHTKPKNARYNLLEHLEALWVHVDRNKEKLFLVTKHTVPYIPAISLLVMYLRVMKAYGHTKTCKV